MKTILNWRKGIFKNTYEIFSAGQPIGSLKENFMSQTAEGEINGKKVAFKTSGFFRQETSIINPESQEVIGKINYNSWMTRAVIEFSGNTLNWKYENIWNTKWSVSGPVGMLLKYSGTSSRGEIESATPDELLILTGLFITNYYWQTALIVIMVVFLPILL